MTIAIVDDQVTDREQLAAFASAGCEALCLPCKVELFPGGEKFLQSFATGGYDAVLLDVYMEGLNGLETARFIREKDRRVPLVFVTVSAQHAVESFDVQAAHYLLKPVSQPKMEAALRACLSRRQINERFVTVKSGYQEYHILLRNIRYTSQGRNHVIIHTTRGDVKVYVSYIKFAPQLLDDARFVQCGYGVLLNLEHVARMNGAGFVLDDGQAVAVPKRERERAKAAWAGFETAMQEEQWL